MGDFENTIEVPIIEEKQLIKNSELRNYLQFKLDKTEIAIEDLDSIDEIILDSKNIVGQINKVYFEEIDLFKNLKRISIRNLGISLDDLKRISTIKELEFINCEISDITQFQNVEHLILNNSEIDNFEKITQLSNIVELQLINMKIDEFEFLKELENLKKLVIKNVKNFSIEKINYILPIEYLSLEKLKELNLDIIKQYEKLTTLSVDRIEADNWDEELNELKNRNIKILLNDIYEY